MTTEQSTPTPNVSSDDTGQHVRVALEELDRKLDGHGEKLDEAIKVDKDDHAAMRKENSDNHGETKGEIAEVKQMVKLQSITLDVIATSMNLKGRVDAAKQEAEVKEIVNKRQHRRAIFYGVLKVLAVAAATWVVSHIAGLH